MKIVLFDEIPFILKRKGVNVVRLYRDLDDHNTLFIIIEWDNLDNQKKVALSEELRAQFQKSGLLA